jgi:hypothetical protein
MATTMATPDDMEPMSSANNLLSAGAEANHEAGVEQGLTEAETVGSDRLVAEPPPADESQTTANVADAVDIERTKTEPPLEAQPDAEPPTMVASSAVLSPDAAEAKPDSGCALPPGSGEQPQQPLDAELNPGQASSISAAKLAANQRNAQLSTGPCTEVGKSHSRRNAVKHGLFASPALLAPEDRACLEELLAEQNSDWKPVGAMEDRVVEQIALMLWRGGRVDLCEQAAAFAETADRTPRKDLSELERLAIKAQLAIPFGETLDRVLRYSAACQRQLLAYIKILLQLQASRRKHKKEETE